MTEEWRDSPSQIKPPPDYLTAEYVNKLIRLDAEAGELYWRPMPGKRRGEVKISGIGYGSGSPRSRVDIHGRRYWRYHIVFLLVHGRWPTHTIDHINGNTLDDRPCNLREATIRQNSCNTKRPPRSQPLPSGVERRRNGRFGARITNKGKYVPLGTYDTAEQAHRAYLEARKAFFGEFA